MAQLHMRSYEAKYHGPIVELVENIPYNFSEVCSLLQSRQTDGYKSVTLAISSNARGSILLTAAGNNKNYVNEEFRKFINSLNIDNK